MGLRRLIAGILFCLHAFASPPETDYSRRIWRSDDGLPQDKIQVITQSADGYLWIGTSGGLVRFDGVRFVVFDRSNTPVLGDDSILSLCPARDGSLWIGTEGGGVVHMKGSVFQAWGAAQGLTNEFVRAVGQTRDGQVWVGTDGGVFTFRNEKLVRIDSRDGIPMLAARSIYPDREGITWIGTNNGLYQVQGEKLVRPASSGFDKLGNTGAILEARDKSFWIASETGLRRVIDGKLQPLRPTDPLGPRTIHQDHEGNMWIGTAGAGLVRMGASGVTVYRSPGGAREAGTLPDNTVLAIFEDREQNLWVGTQDGLLRMTRTAVHTITSKDGLADDNVVTVYGDPYGRLWIGTLTGRLYSLQGDKVTPFQTGAFHARGTYVDREGVQWFASAGQGFLRVANGKSRIYTVRDGLRSNFVRQFLEDRRGTIWIATTSGLSRWDAQGLKTFYLEDGLAYGGVRVLAEDHNGDLLVGTDGGLNRLHNGRFVHDPVFAKLGGERVWSIHPDSNGTLWLGTRSNGLIRIRDSKITRYTTRDGLLNNTIYQILIDDQNRFWMSSPAGVFAVDRKELDAVAEGRAGPIVVVPYGTDSGLLSSQMNGGAQSAGYRAPGGEFWFPSVKGAVRIDPRQSRVQPASPVLVESVIADDKSVPLLPTITIPPGRGKLQIDYTAPDLLSPERVTFRYRLENFDEAWTPAPRSRSAYYTNLPPGKYRFHVVARDGARNGKISEAILPIVWQPHFYETYWFYALLAILTALCIWAVFRFYARQTRDRYALVLAERTRLAREMHDTVIQGCVGVSTLLEAARSMPPSAQQRVTELLERAATQVRLTVNEARDAVWDLRNSTINLADIGQADQPADVVHTLQSFARQVETSEGIPVHAEVDGTPLPLGNPADRNLLLIAREAIRNAVTHAQAEAIRVNLRFDLSEVRLQVSDDGRGFSVESAPDDGHYGIIGMRERVEQSGGTFHLTSSPGKGTLVIAVLPFRRKK